MAIGIRDAGSSEVCGAADRLFGSAADTMVGTTGKLAFLLDGARPLLVGEAALF
jgi:hypothetical protein